LRFEQARRAGGTALASGSSASAASLSYGRKGLARDSSGAWLTGRHLVDHLAEGGRVARAVATVAKTAIPTRKVVDALRATSFFGDLAETQLATLAATGRTKLVPRYGILYREDSVASCFYILLQGTLEPSKATAPSGVPITASQAAAGSQGVVVGTEALSSLPRAATLSAADDCVLLQFPGT